MASFNPAIWLRLHWFTRAVVIFVFAALIWLNLDFTREEYVSETIGGFNGGVRYGFPLPWWDGGRYATANPGEGLRTRPYGGLQWGGLALDLVAMLATLAATTLLCERLRKLFCRDDTFAARTAAPVVKLGWLTALAVMLSATMFVGTNLRLKTYVAPDRDAGIDIQHQEMGWPLKTYRASEPVLFTQPQLASADSRILFKARPDLWRRRAHWEERNIVLNIFIGLVLSGLAGALCQRLQKFNLRSK